MNDRNTTAVTFRALALVAVVGVAASGCASHKFVRKNDEATRAQVGEQLDGVSGELEQVQGEVADLGSTVDEHGEQIDGLSQTTREALERAIAAGKLAEGKFLFESVLDDNVNFGFEKTSLTDAAKAELDIFAAGLSERNENVYVEIQGHTDSTGDEEYNLTLGERRAENVRRYLSLEHGVALHRMGVISYGEAAPVADNSNREGRASNRRVALVVLR